jgi:hypothetical protein
VGIAETEELGRGLRVSVSGTIELDSVGVPVGGTVTGCGVADGEAEEPALVV